LKKSAEAARPDDPVEPPEAEEGSVIGAPPDKEIP
jgi:hypothetical protein